MVRTILDRFLEYHLNVKMYYNYKSCTWFVITSQGELEIYENAIGDILWLYDKFGNKLCSSSDVNEFVDYINDIHTRKVLI